MMSPFEGVGRQKPTKNKTKRITDFGVISRLLPIIHPPIFIVVLTFCQGSCPIPEYPPSAPCVFVSPQPLATDAKYRRTGRREELANGQTHIAERPDRPCSIADRR